MSSGVIVGQAINFLGMPIISRIYNPAAIGDYTVITSSASIINAVATLGLMTSFMLPKEDEKARGLSRLVTVSTLIITAIAISLAYIFSDEYTLFDTEKISYGAALLVLWAYSFFYTVSNICYAYVNRMKQYNVMFWNPIIGSGINIILGIIFGALGWGFVGYTLAHIISFSANIIHLIVHANPYARIVEKQNRAIPMLREYIHFPKFQMPANLISTVANQMPVYVIGAAFSTTVLGGYSMCMRIMNLPASLLATPVNRIYFREASERYNNGKDIAEFTFKIMRTNIKLAIVPICILMVFGRQIFSFFLGAEWEMAGQMASVIGVYQLLLFSSQCTSGDFTIIRKNSWNLISSICILIMQIVLFVIFNFVVDSTVYMYLFAMALCLTIRLIVAQIVFFAYLKMKLKVYFIFLFKYIIAPCIICGIINFIIY